MDIPSLLSMELLTKWTPHKFGSLRIAGLMLDVNSIYFSKDDLRKRSVRIGNCSTFLEFKSNGVDSSKLAIANFCRDRFCPMCQWRRSLKIFSQFSKVADFLKPKKYRYLFLTLTVPNVPGDKLDSEVDRLLKAFRFLTNKDRAFMATILGTFRCLEVTFNKKADTYHPHIHAILAVQEDYFGDAYKDSAWYAKRWAHALGEDYDPKKNFVHIEAVHGLEGSEIAEVAKYPMKSSDIPNSEVLGAFMGALHGRRLVSMSGVFRQAFQALNLNPEDNDLIHIDDKLDAEILDTFISLRWAVGSYVIDDIYQTVDA